MSFSTKESSFPSTFPLVYKWLKNYCKTPLLHLIAEKICSKNSIALHWWTLLPQRQPQPALHLNPATSHLLSLARLAESWTQKSIFWSMQLKWVALSMKTQKSLGPESSSSHYWDQSWRLPGLTSSLCLGNLVAQMRTVQQLLRMQMEEWF